MKFFRLLAVTVVLVFGNQAHADIVVGDLSRTTGSDVIVDTLNNRQWMGWDVTRGLNYAQTEAATQSGGRFEGYSIAHFYDVQLFLTSMLGPLNCTPVNYSVCANNENNAREQLVGESYANFPLRLGVPYDFEIVFFLNDSLYQSNNVGLIEVETQYNGLDRVNVQKYWASISDSNRYTDQSDAIGWLLYSELTNSVPEPAPIALLSIGLLGLLVAPRRKQK